VTSDRALEGYRLGVTGATPLSASGLRGMLAAWRDFLSLAINSPVRKPS